MHGIPFRGHYFTGIGRTPVMSGGVQPLLSADALYVVGGPDVSHDLKVWVFGRARLTPGTEAFDNRRFNLDPGHARR
jgi:hypothetical protein